MKIKIEFWKLVQILIQAVLYSRIFIIEYWKDEIFLVHTLKASSKQWWKGIIELCLKASSAAVRVRSSNSYSLCSPQRRMSKMHALIGE